MSLLETIVILGSMVCVVDRKVSYLVRTHASGRLELRVLCLCESFGDFIHSGLPGICYGPQVLMFGANACSWVLGALDHMPL